MGASPGDIEVLAGPLRGVGPAPGDIELGEYLRKKKGAFRRPRAADQDFSGSLGGEGLGKAPGLNVGFLASRRPLPGG